MCWRFNKTKSNKKTRKDEKDKEGLFLKNESMPEKDKEGLFLKNESMSFEELIVSIGNKYNHPIRFFSAEELMKATKYYDQRQMIHEDAYYQLYKGYLENQKVTVKKYKHNLTYLEEADLKNMCVMEVVTICQMVHHENVVKLLGCCVETNIPTLVYEFASSGILSNHLPGSPSSRNVLQLSSEARLKIAAEIASAISDLHTSFSRPIVIRDLKISNVLLDQNFVAKLQDFSLAMQIPVGETHVEDAVRGTTGWGAPEYVSTGFFSEKIDVYSFGIFLSMLFTGRKGFNHINGFLVDSVKRAVESNCSSEILDPVLRIVGMNELQQQQLKMGLELAVRCVEVEENQRPTMMYVTKELRRIQELV